MISLKLHKIQLSNQISQSQTKRFKAFMAKVNRRSTKRLMIATTLTTEQLLRLQLKVLVFKAIKILKPYRIHIWVPSEANIVSKN